MHKGKLTNINPPRITTEPIWKRLSLSAKLAYTHYWDRDLIGTDTEEISGSDKTDLYALLRWKF